MTAVVNSERGGVFQQPPLRSGIARNSPHLPYVPKSGAAVSCARHRKPDSPSGSSPVPHPMESIRRMRGFPMKANEGSNAEAASSSPRAESNRAGRGVAPPEQEQREMEIMIFSIKLDKFTGFFDKFLKIYCLLIDFYSKSYHSNMSAAHSDSATKKFFGSCAFPRNCPHLRTERARGCSGWFTGARARHPAG